MKIVILTNSNNFAANYILARLPENKDIEIVGIVQATNKVWKYVKRIVLISGILISLRFLALIVIMRIFGFLKKKFWTKRKTFEAEEIAEKYKIPYFNVKNINSEESVAIIKKLKPDLIISNYFEQILKRKILNIPIKGVINIHPGLLPMYRGTYAYFWKLVNKEKKAGVTIHFVTRAVDKGKILAQKSFEIAKGDTVVDLLGKGAKLGSKLLDKVLRKIKEGKAPCTKMAKEKGKYYTFPDRKAVETFYENGKKLFTIKSLLNYL